MLMITPRKYGGWPVCLGTVHSSQASDFLYLLFTWKREGPIYLSPAACDSQATAYDSSIVNSSHSLATENQNHSKWTFENCREFLEQLNTYTVHSSVSGISLRSMFVLTSNRISVYVAHFLCRIVNLFGPIVMEVIDLGLFAPIYLKYILDRPKQWCCHRACRRR
jgi:hypothetical protein